jgi:hypothetical protein
MKRWLPLLALIISAAFAQPASAEWEIFRAKSEYNDQMDHIPKAWDRLVSAETLRRAGSEPGTSFVWFEASDGTVRLAQFSIRGGKTLNNYVWSVVQEFPRR